MIDKTFGRFRFRFRCGRIDDPRDYRYLYVEAGSVGIVINRRAPFGWWAKRWRAPFPETYSLYLGRVHVYLSCSQSPINPRGLP